MIGLVSCARSAAVIARVGCAGSASVIGWILLLLLRLVVRTQTLRSSAWFGGEDADPMLLGEVTDSSPPGSGILAAQFYLSMPPTRQDLTQGQ